MASMGRMIIPALIGGIIISVCSMIPFVGYLCCLYVPFGGLVAAALTKSMGKEGEKLESGDGMTAGALAGVVAALLYALLMAVIALVFGGLQVGLGALAALASRSLEPLLAFGTMGIVYTVVMLLCALLVAVVYFAIYATLGAVGGMIGASMLYKK